MGGQPARNGVPPVVRRLLSDAPEPPEVRHLVDDFSTQLALVAAGDIMALVPRLARPPLPDGLVSRTLDRPPKREVHAVWRSSAAASPAVRALLTELITSLAADL